jgi:hypothetical protein
MAFKILLIANPVICESALPNFTLSTEYFTEGVGVSALDQLNGVLNRYVARRSEQKMNVSGHNDEGMKLKSAFATIAIKSLQKKSGIVLDDEESSSLPS